ncbi:MAG: acyl-CoA dehydrogenase family protein [Kofleriaceae bacterium]
MQFALDSEQDLTVQTLRRFADRDLRSWAADADRAAAPPAKLAATAGDLGFMLDAVPSEAGGLLDGDYSHLTRVLRGYELGRGCAALAALLETNVEPALAVATWGSDAAKRSLFGALSSGGYAALYHDSRGQLQLTSEGSDLCITGKLGPCPALGVASHVVIATGDALVLLPITSDIQRTAIAPSGWRAAQWGTANLDATKLSGDFVLARGDAARQAVTDVLSWARVSLAARAAGVAAAAMEHAQSYAAERIQFGQPIGTFESIIRLRDDAQTQTAAARLFALHAAWAIDQRRPDAADLASRARVLANDAVSRATIDAVQIYGGYGFVNDFPVEKLMRDARAFEALHGDERLSRVLAAKASQE